MKPLHRRGTAPALALLLLACATAPAPRPAGPPAFLWEARQGDRVLYLVGSIHLGKKDALALSPSMQRAFAESAALVVELDPERQDPGAMQRFVVDRGMAPAGEEGLLVKLEPQDRAALSKVLFGSGVPEARFDRLRPWLASLMLTMLQLTQAGYEMSSGVDSQFLARAHAAQKQVVELETIDQQLNLFAQLPDDQQLLMFKEQLRTLGDDPVEKLNLATAAWMTGDAAKMDHELLEELRKPEYQEVYTKLILDRNLAMADRLAELASSGKPQFVVVGAAHVIGDQGLVRLLGQRGWAVRQLARE